MLIFLPKFFLSFIHKTRTKIKTKEIVPLIISNKNLHALLGYINKT